MVKPAYSSGTPSQGVGTGNVVSVVNETANLLDVANKIMQSKTFDNATSCSTENSVLIHESKYQALVKELEKVGGFLCNAEEKAKLQKTMWDPATGALSPYIVAQSAAKIARLAGINLPEGKTFMMVEDSGIGKGYPFSEEKLCVTMALSKWKSSLMLWTWSTRSLARPFLRYSHSQRRTGERTWHHGESISSHGKTATVPCR